MLKRLLDNIYQGYDGLIRDIEIYGFRQALITVSVIKKEDNQCVNIQFKMDDLTEFAVKQKLNYSNVVLSRGIVFKLIDNIYYLDFSPYSEIIENEDDFRKSDCYFATKLVSHQEMPYSE